MSLEVACAGPSLEEIASAIEKRIKQIYREYRNYYHVGYMPSADLTYGLWCGKKTALYFAEGPIVTKIGTQIFPTLPKTSRPPFSIGYKGAGVGTEITDYINAKMNLPSVNVSDGIVLAMYMLKQASIHARGCGGDLRVMWLGDDGTVDRVKFDPCATALLDGLDEKLNWLFLASANTNKADVFVEKAWEDAKALVFRLRGERKQEIEKIEKDREEFRRGLEELMSNPERAIKILRGEPKG